MAAGISLKTAKNHFFTNIFFIFFTFIHLDSPSLTLIDLHW